MVYIPPSVSYSLNDSVLQQGAAAPGTAPAQGSSTADMIAGGTAAAGGATKTLVSLLMGNRAKKKRRRIEKIMEAERRKDFENAIRESELQEGDEIRRHERMMPEVSAHFAGRGMESSSAKTEGLEDEKYMNRRRIDALRIQRARLRQGFAAGEKIRDIQRQIQKIEEQEAAIAATIDTVISVASILSDRNVKEDIRDVDSQEVLDGLVGLRISRWTYKEGKGPGGDHMGPMAQDFARAFGLGNDPTRIETVDAVGVLLKVAQALAVKVQRQDRMIRELQRERV